MPGRIASSGHASPGPQVLAQQDRPVPAVRRSTQQFHRSDASQPPPGLTDRVDVYRDTGSLRYSSTVPNNNGFKHQHSTDDKHNGDVSTLTSYRPPAQPQKPVSTVRPQSAMAMTSPSHNKHGYTDRPPSSMGVTWTPPNQRAEGGARRVSVSVLSRL
ncbi:uncharacterized protein LOC131944980 [Physella acuta]|uniref:uncharacterized protein LOC131944980 n=1 Tax=Physella acuta TaxID=109671 RepID=UPI0027DD2D12|nr:uncharacterized protein LOC131944980 [Physella acuta]